MAKRAGAGELDVPPDDLPDGLVIADDRAEVTCFNAEAGRLTGLDPAAVVGRPLEKALPLEDPDGRPWWRLTDPYHGLATRCGQPERNLLLPGGREVLVTARYVRARPGGPVRRVVIGLRGTEARQRIERSNADSGVAGAPAGNACRRRFPASLFDSSPRRSPRRARTPPDGRSTRGRRPRSAGWSPGEGHRERPNR
jgi:hypothetical protein